MEGNSEEGEEEKRKDIENGQIWEKMDREGI